MKRFTLPTAFEGLIYWGVLLTLIATLLLPQIGRIASADRLKTEKQSLIETHRRQLMRPAPADDSLSYQSLVYDIPSDDPNALSTSDIQSLLSEQVRFRQARLLNLRALPPPPSIGDLKGVRFALEIEGDLTAALETVESIGQLGVPILIDQFDLKPFGRSERSDRAMQLQLVLTVWQEGAN